MTHKAYLQDSYENALRKNLELQAQLAAWQALGRELIELFSIGYSTSPAVGENLVLINRDMYGLYDKNSLEYQVLSRLLELTSE